MYARVCVYVCGHIVVAVEWDRIPWYCHFRNALCVSYWGCRNIQHWWGNRSATLSTVNLYVLPWNWTQASLARSLSLTAWIEAWPMYVHRHLLRLYIVKSWDKFEWWASKDGEGYYCVLTWGNVLERGWGNWRMSWIICCAQFWVSHSGVSNDPAVL